MKQFLLSRLKRRWLLIPGFAVIAALHIHRNLPAHPERVERIVVMYAIATLLAIVWPSGEMVKRFLFDDGKT